MRTTTHETSGGTSATTRQVLVQRGTAGLAGGLVGGVVFGLMMQTWDMIPWSLPWSRAIQLQSGGECTC
jgi:hypothetical protein